MPLPVGPADLLLILFAITFAIYGGAVGLVRALLSFLPRLLIAWLLITFLWAPLVYSNSLQTPIRDLADLLHVPMTSTITGILVILFVVTFLALGIVRIWWVPGYVGAFSRLLGVIAGAAMGAGVAIFGLATLQVFAPEAGKVVLSNSRTHAYVALASSLLWRTGRSPN